MKINREILVNLAIEKGYGKKDLAEKAGVTFITVYKAFNGDSISLKSAGKLATALGVSPSELIVFKNK